MHPPPLTLADAARPLLGALVFVAIMSFVREPTRHRLNAVLVAGATGVYLNGGLGAWELLYLPIAMPVVYLGLRSYRFIGVAWIMHATWDLVHHLWGNPIWPFMPTSSFGCLLFDACLAWWCFAGAPAILGIRAGALDWWFSVSPDDTPRTSAANLRRPFAD